MRAGIYARYSSDNQHERSIDDQVRLCRERAESQGALVVEVYADYARSGAHALSRPALQQIMADAKVGRFDLVIAEALDRISRDQEDIAAIHKRLRHVGVRIHTLSEGDVDELHIGLKGTMNALFLKDLAAKIRRGQRGRAEAGRSPGGLSYGYAVVREYDAAGEPVRGLRRIDEAQAAVVRRIFREFVTGRSGRTIAAGLNRDGIPGPTGGAWRASTINGSRARRSGILYNEAYIGFVVYNRIRMVRDPETGRRISRPNPPAEWIAVAAPELRIIDDETWDAAQSIKSRRAAFPVHVRRRPKRLLSGLARCGVCGGGASMIKPGRIGCSAYREGRSCTNNQTIAADAIEARVLDGIREHLLAPEIVAEAVREYHKAVAERRQAAHAERDRAAAELRKIDPHITRIIDHLCEGTETEGMKERLIELENRKAELKRTLEEAPPPAVLTLHPNAIETFRKEVAALAEVIDDPEDRDEAIAILRSFISEVRLFPTGRRGDVRAELHGRLANAIAFANGGKVAAAGGMIMVVAEDRYRHYHPTVKAAV